MGITQTCIVLKPSRHGADTYMPGDMVRGAVVLFIGGSSPCKVSEVTLKVKGQARTNLTTNNGTWTSWYSEKESFLKFGISILRVRKGAPTSLPPGENQLNFSFTLPDGLPHSHEYSCGEVVYKLVARAISCQHLSWNGSTKMHFTVLQRRDLRTMPQLARRLVVERKSKHCKRDDPGEFTIILGRQGFVPGETIDVYVQGTDGVLSVLARNEGIVKLKRFEEFRANGGTQQHKPVLVKKRLGMDPAEWRHFQLTMPKDDVGIDPDVCHIIAVSHYIKIWDVHLPVTLGTIPLGKRSSSAAPSRTASGASLAQSSQTPSKPPPRTSSGTALAPFSQALSKILSKTISGTPLASSSQTPSKAPSRTPSKTPLAPSSRTPSKTPSRSPSGTTLTNTPSRTLSKTPSRSPSGTTLTDTPSRTPSKTPSGAALTDTPSRTPSKTPSRSPSGTTLTDTPSRTPSKTPSRSPSGTTLTETPSWTPSKTPSGAALTDTPSRTPSKTPSGAALTDTPSRTPSKTPSGAALTDTPSSQSSSRSSSNHTPSSQTPSRTPSETSRPTSPPSLTSLSLATVSQLPPSPPTPLSQQTGTGEVSRPGYKTTDV